MRQTVRLALALAGLAFITCPDGLAQAPPPSKAVTFDDVLAQVRAGKPPADVLDGCDVVFTLTPDQRDELARAGAPPALVAALQAKRIAVGDVTDFVVILDCSGSMQDEIAPGQTKMDAAKKVVGELFRAIPNGRNLAFIVYGHEIALKCQAVKTIRPLAPITAGSRAELTAALGRLAPAGHTPIAASLREAGKVLAESKGMSQVVVITDGIETCHGDPAAEAEKLTQVVPGLRAVEVIGVGLKTAEEKEAVAVVARRGRGKFYDTDSADDLKKAVARAVDVAAIAVDEDGFTPLNSVDDWKVLKGKDDNWMFAPENTILSRGDMDGWLMTKKEYADFELRLDVKLTVKGANTGFAFRNSLGTDPGFVFNEVQFLDEELSRRQAPIDRSGGIYDIVGPQKENAAKPVGAWNDVRIIAKGRHLTVTINDTQVSDVDLARYEHRTTDKAGGRAIHPELLRKKGHLGLQSWKGKIEFRNVRIKDLTVAVKTAR